MKTYLHTVLAIVLFSCLATQVQAQCADETERMKFIEAVRRNCATCIDGANQIIDAEAAKVIVLDVSYNNLTCMDGIDKFIALKSLECQVNKLVSLPDLSKNTMLQILICTRNQLTRLPDLSMNSALLNLHCFNNQLSRLPDLSKNTALTFLDCYNNQLTSLPDLSKNKELSGLDCSENQITSLPDLSKNAALTHLWCDNNPLCSIGNLPNSIEQLTIRNAIDCLPNIPKNLVVLDDIPVVLPPFPLDSYKKCVPKIFTAPKVSFTTIDNLCIFQKGVFNITSPISNDVKYVWDFGDGSTSDLLRPAHDYAKAGEYTVSLSATNMQKCGGEMATSKNKIVVNPTIAPKINYPTVVCPNDESEFSTSAACGKLEWVVSGGTISSGQGSSKIKVLWGDGKNGNGKVTLSASQCGTGYCEIPVSVEIPIVPTDFSINGSVLACQNQQNTYRINFKGNALSTIFTWTVTGGTVVGGKLSGYGLDSIQVLWGAGTNGKITLSTRNEILTKCGGAAVLDVQLKPSFTISGLTKACANGTSVYSASNFDSYNWSVEGTNSIDPFGQVSWGSKAGLYKVIATPIVADYCNAADTVQVRVVDNPVISAIEGALEVDPNSVQIYKALVGSTNAYINWEVTNGVIQNKNDLYATVKWDASGGFALKATARGSPDCVSKSVEMKVKTNPVFTISGPTSVCISDVVPYTVTSDAIGNVTYLWKTLGGAKDQNPTSVNNSIAFFNPGKQQVTLEAKTNGKTFLATREVIVSALSTSLLVQGSLFIDPSSNSTFVYSVQNPYNLDFDVQVIGATNYSVSGNNINITWGASEPYSVLVIGKKAGELCKGVPVTLQVQKIPFLLNEIKTTTAACLNTEVEYSFKPDKFVKTPVWFISGGGKMASQTDSTLKVLWGNMPGNFTVSLAYDHFGAKLASLPVNLNELPKPEINKVTICGENAATLSVKGSYAFYEWFKEGEIASISSASSPSITTEGMYSVKVKDFNGCNGISNQYVEQSPLPNADIFVDQSSFCQDLNGVPKSVTISALEGVNFTYQWYKDNTVITNATQSVLQVNVPLNAISKHSYWVHIERKGCSNESIKKELQVIDCGTVDPGGGNPCTEPAVTFTYSSNCQPIAFSTSETNATWDFGDGTTSALSSITKTFSKAGIYNVSLSKGCSAFSRSIEIAVNPLFKLTSPTCQNQASSFKDFSTNLPSIKIDSWTWDFGDNSPIVTGSGIGSRDVSHVFANIGTYLVTLTLYTKASNQNNCTYSYKVPVTIKESPVASFETVIPSCAESEYMFNLLQKDPTWSYLWKFDLSNTSVVESPSINFSTLGSHEVKLVVKNLYCKDSTTKTIQVVAPEQAEKLQVSGNTLLCNGSKVTLISPPADGYVWEKNGVVMPINTSDIEVSTAGKYRVTYSKGSCDIITDEIEIRQFLSGAQVEGPLVFCSGDLVQFDTKLSSDLYTFAWTKNNQPLLSTSSVLSLPNITNAEDGYYQVTATDRQNGCFEKLPSKYVQVNQKQPKPVLVANKNTVCAGEALELKTTSDIFFKTILWFKSGQLLNEQSSSLKIPITSVSDAGTYRLMIFDNNTACSDFTDVEISVKAPVVLNIGADKEVCQGKDLTLSATLPVNYTYEWYLNNSLLSQETSSSLTIKEMSASKAGDYEVKATANTEGNCVATSNKVKVSMLSLPAQAVISGNSTLCSGDTVLLTSNVSSNIEWNTGETTPDIRVIRGGQYFLKVKNPTTGCYSEQTKVITQYLSPDFGFFPAGVYSLCGSNEVSFDGLKSYPTFQWYLDGRKLRNADFNLFPTKTGKYTVEVETKDGCKRTSDTLRITSLECPCLVTNTNDAGDGSLREAIKCANTKVGKDKIKFAIPGTGPFTISPLTPLPIITDSVVINGFSQAGEGKYYIVLDGSLILQDGLVFATGVGNSEITGLQFESFNSAIVLNELVSNTLVYKNNISSSKGSAIYLNTSSNNRITKNQILEANIGIELNGSDKNTIDSNVVSKSRSHGILVQNSQSAQLKRNYIGTDVQMSDLGNAGFGILLQDGSNNAVVSQNFLLHNKESNIGARLNSDFNYFDRNVVAFTSRKGINLEINGDFGNKKIQAPTILSASVVGDSVEIIGTSNPNVTIHLYSGDGGVDNALAFVKTTVSAFDNSWIIRLPLSYFNAAPFYYFLATTTDYQYNTSEFSNVFKYENCILTGIQNTQFSVESPICLGSKSVLTIKSSVSTYQYQVFEKAKEVSKLTQGTGNDLLVDVTGLEAGNHTFTIHVSKAGCISDTIKNTPKVVVNTDPKTDLSVGTNGPVCDGNQAKFFILKPEIGTSYQIFDGQTAVSQTGIGKVDSLILTLNKLSIGDHELKARATNAGCKVAEIGASGKITINSAPKTDLMAKINGSVCLGNEAEVKIYPSEIGKYYEVRTKNTSISDQKIGIGDTLKLTVNTTTLNAGEHKLTVGVSVAGCVADTLVSNLKLKINTDPKTDLSVGTNGPVCDGNQAKFFILKPEIGTSYQIFDGQTAVSQTGIGVKDSLILSLNKLSIGDHDLKARATNAGCKQIELGASGRITINSAPKTNLETFINGPVCLGNEAEVKIYPSEIGKFYEVQENLSAISDQKIGTGDTLKLTVNTTNLIAGEHKLTVGVSVAGCVADTLVSNLKLKINTDPKNNLSVGTNGPVCDGNQAKFFILKPETGTSYQIFDGQNAVSQTGIGKGDSLILSLNKLSIGDHELKARATNAGCNVAELGASGKITINSAPITDLMAKINGPVCLGNEVEVKIFPSEIGKFYEVRTKNTSISDQKTGTGDTLILTVNTTTLQAGEHKLTVGVSVAGCVADTLVSNLKLNINTDPKTDLSVGTNSPVCDGNQARFYILKPEIGTSYQIFDGQRAVSQTGIGKGDSLILSLNKLSIGDHELKARATNAGCKITELGASAKITINSAPKTNLNAFINGPVCLGNAAEVKIYPSEIGKFYEVQKNLSAISDQKIGTGDTLKLTVSTTTLQAGEHKLTIGVSVAGCVADTLVSNLKLKINTDPKTNLTVGTNGPVCDVNQAKFFILKPEIGTTYQIFNGQSAVSHSEIGKGDSLILTLNQLSIGDHILKARATNVGCKETELGASAKITINSAPKTNLNAFINGPVCLGNEAEVKIYPSEIGKYYEVRTKNTSISGQKTGTGDTLKLTVNTTTLQAGEHKLTVGVSVAGCVADTLVSNLKLKINIDPKTDLSVGTNGPVCNGNQGKFFILKPEIGTSYQIFDGQTAVSQTGIGVKDSLILVLNQLSIGDHTLKARATNAGCKITEIGASGKITINSAPRTDLMAKINGPVCLGNEAEVKIYPSEIGKYYEVRTKNTSISDQKTGTGDTLKLTVSTTTLQAGEHKLTVGVSVAGCVADTLISNLKLKINTDPKTNLTVGTNGPVCDGNQAKFFILKPETGTSYQIFDGQKAVSQTGIGVKDSLILILNQLSIGDHTLKARATNAGCKITEIGASGKITINSAPKTNLEAFINGPVCLGNEAEVKIYPSEIGKYYEVRTKNTSISDQKTGTGDTLKLTVNTTNLQAGEHKLTVGVSVPGCVADTLVSNLKLKINIETRSDISFLKGSSICMYEELAQVTVLKAEKDIHYRMNYFNTVYSQMGIGEDLVFEIPKDSLSQGRNEVSFYATSRGCKTVKLDNTANVFLLGSKKTIQGASILCYNSIGNFSINPIEGALSYNWTVPLVDMLLSGQGTNQVRVSIGQKESEIKVVPVGTNRACQESEASLNVQVFPRFRGLNFQKTDTACINQTYLFSLDSTFAIGVKSLKWTWTSGIRIESPIDSSTKKAQGTFVQSGIQQVFLSPTEECTGLVRKPDTLTIRVLEYPVAEAGEYDVIENDLQQPIFLNGTGSSENNLNEKYFTKWSSPNLFVQNANLLVNASFVPVDEETKVYLSVAHAGKQGRGYCEAKDSVVIKIKPMIEVPNVFSPNHDGVHDAWEIPHLNRLFPNCIVEVFNKWGAQVHQSTGYNEPWDGTRNGQELPISTYYYIIDLKNGSKPMVKSVTILK